MKRAGNHIKNCCLPRAVGADQAYDFSFVYCHINVADSNQTAKLFDKIAYR